MINTKKLYSHFKGLLNPALAILIIPFVISCEENEMANLSENLEVDDEESISISQEVGSIVKDEYIVLFKPEAVALRSTSSSRSIQENRLIVEGVGKDLFRDYRIDDRQFGEVISGEVFQGIAIKGVTDQMLKSIVKDERVLEAVPNKLYGMSIPNPLEATFRSILVPSDDKTLQKNSAQVVNYLGGVINMEKSQRKVWIIDSGIDLDHPDLNVNKSLSRSFVPNENTPDDLFGHGTHVAGIVGAKMNGKGTTGMAAGIELVSIKVLDKDGVGSDLNLMNAINYLQNALQPGDIVNLSILTEHSQCLLNFIDILRRKDIYITVAAGNFRDHVRDYLPASVDFDNVYVVGALNADNSYAQFSNYGSQETYVLAPGEGIYSTFKDGQYARLTGTSMAAPYVAGILASTKDPSSIKLDQTGWTPAGRKFIFKR